MNPAKRTLRVVPEPDAPGPDSPSVWSTESFPLTIGTRPGELAYGLPLQLSEARVADLRRRARERGIPGRVLLRLDVESARQLLRAERLSGIDRRAIAKRLDALSVERPAITTIAQGPLWGYASALRRGGGQTMGLPAALELPVSAEQAAGWSAECNQAGLSLDDWVDVMLDAAPANAERWEAAAAETGRYLADWVLGSVMPMTCAAAAAHVRAGREST